MMRVKIHNYNQIWRFSTPPPSVMLLCPEPYALLSLMNDPLVNKSNFSKAYFNLVLVEFFFWKNSYKFIWNKPDLNTVMIKILEINRLIQTSDFLASNFRMVSPFETWTFYSPYFSYREYIMKIAYFFLNWDRFIDRVQLSTSQKTLKVVTFTFWLKFPTACEQLKQEQKSPIHSVILLYS